MPSLKPHHHRTYSWPPSWHHISPAKDKAPNAESPLTEIDEDPFSHFISPVVEEDDPMDSLAYSAGIVANESDAASKASKFRAGVAKKWARYVASNHEALHTLYHVRLQESDSDSSTDKDDMDPWEDKDAVIGAQVPVIREPPGRSRREQILAEAESRGKRPRPGRTLSGHRHSWQEPSVNLFTVMEEGDDIPAGTGTGMETGDGDDIVVVTTEAKDGASRRSVKPEATQRAKL